MLQRITVKKLNRISKKHQICCMGCGKRLNEILELYQKEPFIENITALIDNNKLIHGSTRQVGERQLEIKGREFLEKHAACNTILLITSDSYDSIYQALKDIVQKKKMKCYLYPMQYNNAASVCLTIIKLLPLKRRLVFYAGNEPHENADEIVKYLKTTQENQYEIIYVDEKTTIEHGIRHVNKWTMRQNTSFAELFKFIFTYGRAEYLFYENEPLEKMQKKQKLIYLNHGTIPLKNVSDVLRQPKEVDAATCPAEGCASLYAEQYGISQEKLIYMMPARVNRMLHCEGKLRELTGTTDEQLILWLPTFRQLSGSSRTDCKETNPIELLERNAEQIHAELQKNGQILVIKKHPREKTQIYVNESMKNIRVLREEELQEKGISLQELLKDADALLTDYSGIAFEYMLLNRPIGYVVSDMELYFRGFAVKNPYEYMPGLKIHDTKELCVFFRQLHIQTDDYIAQRKQLVSKLFGNRAYQNGAEALAAYLTEQTKEKKLWK